MIELKSDLSGSQPAAAGSASANAYDLKSCVLKSRRASKLSAAAQLTVVRPLSDPNAASSLTAQVVANIAAQLSPVTVVPTFLDESAKSAEPLCAGDEAHAVRQVVSQEVIAAAANRGLESVPEEVLANIADAVALSRVPRCVRFPSARAEQANAASADSEHQRRTCERGESRLRAPEPNRRTWRAPKPKRERA